MERIYAQVLKEDMMVNLIGGRNEGLPINHPAVIVVDITERVDKDEIKVSMTYDPIADVFAYEKTEIVEVPAEATQLDRIEAAIVKSKEEIIDEYTLQLVQEGVIA